MTKTFNSAEYWNSRYISNGNSGAGAYGKLGLFKASILNKFIKEHNINSVVEFGCGDGNQLSMSNYKLYTGYDVSRESINICKEKFKEDHTKSFYHISEYNNETYDLSLSLDVIYHLIEDDVYQEYIKRLFSSTNNFVIIYSSNSNSLISNSIHVKHRKFIDDVPKNFKCIEIVKNIYPFNNKKKKTTSFSDFYIFRKTR